VTAKADREPVRTRGLLTDGQVLARLLTAMNRSVRGIQDTGVAVQRKVLTGAEQSKVSLLVAASGPGGVSWSNSYAAPSAENSRHSEEIDSPGGNAAHAAP
jgi:hypothetical protein